jgi:hypothetical protein
MARYTPLKLSKAREGKGKLLADPIDGTSEPKKTEQTKRSMVEHYSITTTADGNVHVVFVSTDAEAWNTPHHLWHFVLGPKGKTLQMHRISEVKDGGIMTRVFVGPAGAMTILYVHRVRQGRTLTAQLEHGLSQSPVKVTKRGPSNHYFVDRWLQLHHVKFNDGKWTYRGPTSVPKEGG